MMPLPHAETVGSLLHSEALIAAQMEDPISAAVRIAVHAPVFIAFPG
jgi:hypothetical protein